MRNRGTRRTRVRSGILTERPGRSRPAGGRVLLLNKPYQVLCQFSRDSGRACLADYVDVPDVYPAGRLDADSEGLVVLTADGRLQQRITDPRHKLPKTYWVQVEGVPTAEQLAHLARGSFQVHTVQPVRQAGEVVSSTRIRQLLGEGQVEAAAELLGEPFVLDGSIVRGKGRGTGIGFPTANLAPETEIVPADGVYTVLCAVEGIEGVLGGAASVGTNPTFGEGERTIEVHLFGEFGHLYGRRIAVAFLYRIREERRFDSVQELVARIGEDVRIARAQVAGWSGPAPVLVPASNF